MFNVFRVESVTPSEDDSKTTKVVLLYCGHRDIFFNRAAGV